MGIEYYIVDDENLECFELGKGNWKHIPLTDKQSMMAYITDHVKQTFNDSTPDEYFEWVVDKVLRFISNRIVTVQSDSEFWENYYINPSRSPEAQNQHLKRCRIVDDRYTS